MKKILVAVYGSLRQGFGNHRLLEGSTFLGDDTITGGYLMYSLYGYPGVVKTEGNNNIKIEVYEVDEYALSRLDRLEGFRGSEYKDNFYNRELIKTKFGDTYIYFLNNVNRDYHSGNAIVESGDWVEYCKTKYHEKHYD